MTRTAEALPLLRIEAQSGWSPLRLSEIWAFRELLYFLAWRDIKVRYKQTMLGATWAILQPLSSMAIFSVFFGKLASMPSDQIPYPVFSYAALLPWIFFSNGVSLSSNSLIGSANLLTKVYFPRMIIPAASIVSGLVDFAMGFLVLIPLMGYFRVAPTLRLLWIPVLLLLAFSAALGVGLWLSAVNVKYRDVRYLVPFLTQLFMFATPVIYPSSLLPEPWRTLFGVNSMVGVIEGFRWSLLGAREFPGSILAISAVSAAAILVSGAFYFRRMERAFADVV